MVEYSVLQPTNIDDVPHVETEDTAPWIVRKLVGSVPGRVVMASFETLRATGVSVVCLSPWGDSSPLLLPCVRFRDLLVHTVIVATGGTAAFVTPAMQPIADAMGSSSFASNIVVEVVGAASHEAVSKGGDWLLVEKPVELMLPKHSKRLITTSVKTLFITIQYKHIIGDAALGFFRSPEHKDASLISNVADYFAIENGWFSPYLFATSRRPVIPRTMKADVVFAHGPFLLGDYEVAETLLAESSIALHFCMPPPPRVKPPPAGLGITNAIQTAQDRLSAFSNTSPLQTAQGRLSAFTKDAMTFGRRSPSPNPSNASPGKRQSQSLTGSPAAVTAALPNPPTNPSDTATSTPPATDQEADLDVAATDINPLSKAPAPPRRMLILLLGIKPHRLGLWTSSARPSESVMQYLLLNGCPAIVVPIKPGSPLVAWDTLTLAQLHKMGKAGKRSAGVVRVVFEYVSLCVDWERVIVPEMDNEIVTTTSLTADAGDEAKLVAEASDVDGRKRKAVKDAIELLVEACMKSGDSKEVKDKVDVERAGITMFRLP